MYHVFGGDKKAQTRVKERCFCMCGICRTSKTPTPRCDRQCFLLLFLFSDGLTKVLMMYMSKLW